MKLLAFETQQELVDAASKGIAVSEILNVEDFEAQYQKNYLAMLGFNGREKYKICTILSEIHNMPGHYVVIGKNNQIVSGLHGDIFYIEDEEEDEEYVD
jgi:ribulose bisphosphate carboxylase small subunit